MAPQVPHFFDALHPKIEDIQRSFDYTRLLEKAVAKLFNPGIMQGFQLQEVTNSHASITYMIGTGSALSTAGTIMDVLSTDTVASFQFTIYPTTDNNKDVWLYLSSTQNLDPRIDLGGKTDVTATLEVYSLFIGIETSIPGYTANLVRVKLMNLGTIADSSRGVFSAAIYNYALGSLTHVGYSTNGVYHGTPLNGSAALIDGTVSNPKIAAIQPGNINGTAANYVEVGTPSPKYFPYNTSNPNGYGITIHNIANNNVNRAKLSKTTDLAFGGAAVGTDELRDASVTAQKLANGAIVQTAMGGGYNLLPAGVILPWAGGLICPTGFKFCDGSLLYSSDYPELFAAIGYIWTWNPTEIAAGNSSTFYEFRLPDLRGKFLRGAQLTRSTGGDVNSSRVSINPSGMALAQGIGSYQTDDTRSHLHSLLLNTSGPGGSGSAHNTSDSGSAQLTGGIATAGIAGFETRPSNIGIGYIIATGTRNDTSFGFSTPSPGGLPMDILRPAGY